MNYQDLGNHPIAVSNRLYHAIDKLISQRYIKGLPIDCEELYNLEWEAAAVQNLIYKALQNYPYLST